MAMWPAPDSGQQPSGVSVVLVEDHGVLRREIADRLRGAGVRVLAVAGTLREGLDAVSTHRPDVAVVGTRLPDGRGVDLCRAVRRTLPQVTVLMHAGIVMPAEEQEALDAGAAAVVLATVRGTTLLSAVLRHPPQP